MRRLCFGVFLTALSTLALELMLTRVFDVILAPNMSYFIVSSAVFAIGLAGIYVSLRPLPSEQHIRPLVTRLAVVLACVTALLVPVINSLPFNPDELLKTPAREIAYFVGIYLALIVPFFLAGFILIAVFSTYAAKIQTLYFWDLVGAGIGCVVIVPFIPMIGPGGLTFCVAGVALIAAALFSTSSKVSAGCVIAAILATVIPFAHMPKYIDFDNHQEHRNIVADKAAGKLEYTKWDPISKIEVLNLPWSAAEYEKSGHWWTGGDRKHIAYDGGLQSSFFYKFDGNLAGLRAAIDRDRMVARQQFWQISVIAADYLKRDTGDRVLVIGSAGGHDTKAALMYGAKHVDAVELVSAVVELGKHQYADYIGNIFNRPEVNAEAGEGRSFLRASHQRYDVIQIHSNHTSSSIAQGNGALGPVYLQTVEAYQEFFSHLTDDGILQINHHMYPRMVASAAVAWKRMGRTDFQKHVVVLTTPVEHMLPTLLIRMTPWTELEIADLKALLSPPNLDPFYSYTLVENPLNPQASLLSGDFYSGDLPKSVSDRAPMRVTPVTDDNPYFNVLRKRMGVTEADPKNFVTTEMTDIPNFQLRKGFIPMDLVHLFGISIVSIFFMCLFVFVPLRFSRVGRQEESKAIPVLAYFACLGCAFIIIELVFIQKFMQLIGSPLYTYSTVIFVLLLASGLGSLASKKVAPAGTQMWRLPFAAIIAIGILFTIVEPSVFHFGLAFQLPGRILVAALLIFPVGFFLGMPFPLGVLAIESRPKGAVAWAWGMNGAFTVIGGVLSVVLSFAFGFTVTLLIAVAMYLVAALVYPMLSPAREPSWQPKVAQEVA
jgi:predicted membrane-bound spermidine synthase